jgi:hypothetical protein
MRSYVRLGTGVVVLVLLAAWLSTGACQARQSHKEARKSASRILYADSLLAPLRPTQALQVTVNATASYDSTTRFWTYSYSVTNDAASSNVLDRFAVTPVWTPVSIVAPPHWIVFYGSDGDTAAVVWSVKDAGPPPANWDGLNLYVGPYNPQPGQTLSGFQIVARQGPASIPFYAVGFDTLQGGGEEGKESPPTMFQEGITGSTIGPDKSSLTGVEVMGSNPVSAVVLKAPQPNPSTGSGSIAFVLPRGGRVRLAVYDVRGRLVRVLIDRPMAAGIHSAGWNGIDSNARPVGAGVYFYDLTVDGSKVGQKKTVIVR